MATPTLFTHEETDALTNMFEPVANNVTRFYMSQFVDVALSYYINYIRDNKELLLNDLRDKATSTYLTMYGWKRDEYLIKKKPLLRVPIHVVRTFRSLSNPVLLAEKENAYTQDGAYFEVLGRRANIYDIYIHTSFRERLEGVLGDKYKVEITSTYVSNQDGVEEFETTLWLALQV